MPIRRPISKFCDDPEAIATLCRRNAEPVFLTRNGRSELVVMSNALFKRQQALLNLYERLDEAEAAVKAGDEGITHNQLMTRIKEQYR